MELSGAYREGQRCGRSVERRLNAPCRVRDMWLRADVIYTAWKIGNRSPTPFQDFSLTRLCIRFNPLSLTPPAPTFLAFSFWKAPSLRENGI